MEIREERSIPVTMECDVLVAGGGIGGISAALAAARQGKRVILLEREYMLGGLATSGLVTIYLPLCDGYGHQVSFGLAEELLRLAVEIHPYHTRGYENWIESNDASRRTEKDPRFEVDLNPQLYAIAAEQLLLKEGVQILYGAYAVSCAVCEDKITHVIIECKGGRRAIALTSCVDATGDCDLGLFAGADTATFDQGNILASWYYSVSDRDPYTLHLIGYSDIPDEEKKKGADASATAKLQRFKGLDVVDNTEFVELSHASIMNHVAQGKKSDPSYEPVTIATIPQLRMTRRVVGAYTLATDEMHTFFEDSIGMVSDWRKRGPVYEVPFGTLYSPKVKNLTFAGRVTSVTEGLWDVMRVIPCCAVTGEAAGIAASMTDDMTALDVKKLQEKLVSGGVVLHETDL